MIPTGTELVDWQHADLDKLQPGQVIETNSSVLGNLTLSSGGFYERRDILQDDLEKIKETIQHAVDSDFSIILILG